MSPRADDYDSPWKQALELYFRDVIAFFYPSAYPSAYAGIDWTKGHKFLDKELQKVVKDAELGRRYADVLAQVWRLDGEQTWVLVHVCRLGVAVAGATGPGFLAGGARDGRRKAQALYHKYGEDRHAGRYGKGHAAGTGEDGAASAEPTLYLRTRQPGCACALGVERATAWPDGCRSDCHNPRRGRRGRRSFGA